MAKVGTLTLDIGLDTKGLEKDLKGAEKALNDFENKNKNLENQKLKLVVDTKEAHQKLIELENRLEYLGKKGEILEGKIASAKTPQAKEQLELQLDAITTQTEKVVAEQDRLNELVNQNVARYDEINKELDYNEKAQKHIKDNISGIRQELIEAKQKQAEFKEEVEETDEAGSKKGFAEGLKDMVKKITVIGLGLAGIRAGMSLLRNSVNTLAGQNDAIATKINTIKAAVANALAPAVEFVINLFKTLLAYVGYIYKAWTGRDIFEKSANSTKKMKNNLGGANKEASKLKRTLAGFDEMNILQKDGGISTGGGGGGVANDVDMSMFEDVEIPSWVQWIADNKDGILATLKDIAIAVGVIWLTVKGVNLFERVTHLTESLKEMDGIFGKLSKAQIFGVLAGAAITLGGIVKLIYDWVNGNLNLVTVLQDLSIMLTGIGVVLVSLNSSSPFGWIAIAVGVIGTLTTSLFDTRSEAEKLKDAQDDLAEAQKNVNRAYEDYVNASKTHLNAYKQVEKAQENVKKTAKELGISEDKLTEIGKDLFEGIRNGTYDIKTLGSEQDGLTKKYGLQHDQLLKVYESYVDLEDSSARLKTATDNLDTTTKNLTEEQKKEYEQNLATQLQLFKTTGNYEKLGEAMENAYDSGVIGADELSIFLSDVLKNMDEETKKTFVESLPDSVKKGVLGAKESIGMLENLTAKDYILKFGMNTSDAVNKIEKLKKKIAEIGTGKFTINYSTSKYAKGGIIPFAKGGLVNLPKLAPGGLINRPGPGVAIGGERGTEGVVPLTDSQQMDRLGMAIGKYVNIRAEIPVSVGNRQVAREIRNINAEESFAYNG